MSHAKFFRPSAAARWMACPGSAVLEADMPDTSSAAADEGTLAHWVASWALEQELDALEYFERYQGAHDCPDVPGDWRVTEDMCKHVQVYVDAVRRSLDKGGPGELHVETRVSFQEALGTTEQADGTADAIILRDDDFEVHDLKYGANPNNRVDAMGNEQLQCYALGVLEQFGHLADFKRATLVIHQPRLDWQDRWEVTIEELRDFNDRAATAVAETALAAAMGRDEVLAKQHALNPSEKACKWCKVKATCPALRAEVERAIASVPEELDALNAAMKLTKLAEDWAKAVRAAVEAALLEGKPLADYKLVEGRRGARSWTDAEAVEKLMKEKFRLKTEQMYDMKLVSPTEAEKLLGDSKRRWTQLEKYIEQKPGKPSVAPMSDKRPPIQPGATTDGMAVIEDDALAALM